MDRETGIQLIKAALDEVPPLKELHYGNQESELWRYKVLTILEQAFGKDSEEYSRFLDARWPTLVASEAKLQRDYLGNLWRYETALKSIVQRHEILSWASTRS